MRQLLNIVICIIPLLSNGQDTILTKNLKLYSWENKSQGTYCLTYKQSENSPPFSGVAIERFGKNYMVIERFLNGNMSHYTSFYPNGNVFISQSFDSTETCFKLDTNSTSYRPCGLAYEYYENGILHIRQNYDHGIPIGTWIYYNDKGRKNKKEYYSPKGKLLKTKVYK
jgi:antitoxin component YwqK of YwqJK toxin-antitoxin module